MGHRPLLGVTGLVGLLGCGCDPPVAHCGPDTQPPAGAPFVSAPHPAFPSVSNHGGRLLARPEVVTVTFAGYAHAAEVGQFGDAVTASQWLAAVAAEYGVVASTQLARATLPGPAPAQLTDPELTALLEAQFGAALPSPESHPDLLLLVYLGPEVTVTSPDGGVLCSAYDGYHASAAHGGRFAYAVVPDCQHGLGYTLSTAAHELVEAAVDPDGDGWFLDVPASDPWSIDNQKEIADLCGDEPLVTFGGYDLPRIWSNDAARAGGSPCVPIPPGEVYVNVGATPATATARVGATVAFTITGWSTAPIAPWDVFVETNDTSAFDPQAMMCGSSVGNGGTTTLLLSVPQGARSGDVGAALVYSGGYRRFWPVTLRAE